MMRCETTRKDRCRYASRCGAQDECSTGSKRCSDSHFSEVTTAIASNCFLLNFAVCRGPMKTDWEAVSNGSLWCSVVDSVECYETFLWKLLITIRKNYSL